MSEEFSLITWENIERLLGKVQKPGRYTGEEYNLFRKDWESTVLKVALAFPDLYEIGLSHLGLRILYELINQQENMLAERVYAPWIDFQALLRQENYPLYTLESKRGLAEFDVVGFSLQYELSYTTVLMMLDLGKIPLHSRERGEHDPLVIAGGPCVFNPEPLADFFDFFLIGEAEEVLIPILEKIKEWKGSGRSRASLLLELAEFEGVYVPAHYEVVYQADGRIQEIHSTTDAFPVRAVVRHFEVTPFPKQWIVPFVEIVHNRIVYEIQRGCTRGCRFCQAGMIYRPAREREPQRILEELKTLTENTGYEELSLSSLSSADYSMIESLLGQACDCFTNQRINVSLPSLRMDAFSIALADKFQGSRKSSLTFAPEAGTDRLRRVINKGVTETDILTAAEAAFRAGWQKLKLYFMIGLPTETEADLAGIVQLAEQVLKIGKQYHPRANGLRITVSVSTFVPKAHTPFQWRAQISTEETKLKQRFLQEKLRGRYLELNWHDPQVSQLEGVFARGDRRLSRVIYEAWRNGAQLDSWGDCFNYQRWLVAFNNVGLEPDFYTRAHEKDEILPWSHLRSGVKAEFLAVEDERAEAELFTADCRNHICTNCGVCSELKVSSQIVGAAHARV